MASDTKQPYEIARETVKQLTSRKLAPTPDNYRAVYFEVAGTKPLPVFPAEPFKDIVAQFKPANPGQQKQLALLDYAISTRNWDTFQNALLAYVGFRAKGPGETVPAPLTDTFTRRPLWWTATSHGCSPSASVFSIFFAPTSTRASVPARLSAT